MKKLKLYFISILLNCLASAPGDWVSAEDFSKISELTNLARDGFVISFTNNRENRYELLHKFPFTELSELTEVNLELISVVPSNGTFKGIFQMLRNIAQHFPEPGKRFYMVARAKKTEAELVAEFYRERPDGFRDKFLLDIGNTDPENLKATFNRMAEERGAEVVLQKARILDSCAEYNVLRKLPSLKGLTLHTVGPGVTLAVLPDYIFIEDRTELKFANKKQEKHDELINAIARKNPLERTKEENDILIADMRLKIIKKLKKLFGDHPYDQYFKRGKNMFLRNSTKKPEEAKTIPDDAKIFGPCDPELSRVLEREEWNIWIRRDDKRGFTTVHLSKPKAKPAPAVREEVVVIEEPAPEAPVEIPSSSKDNPKMKAAEAPVVPVVKIPKEALGLRFEIDKFVDDNFIVGTIMPKLKSRKKYPVMQNNGLLHCANSDNVPDKNLTNLMWLIGQLGQGKDVKCLYRFGARSKMEIARFINTVNENNILRKKIECPDEIENCPSGAFIVHKGAIYLQTREKDFVLLSEV